MRERRRPLRRDSDDDEGESDHPRSSIKPQYEVTVLTRYHLSVVGLLVGAFLVITLFKYGGSVASTDREVDSEPSSDTLVEANEFWSTYGEATDARTAGHYEEAVRLYQRALDRRPGHRDARFYLGQSLLQSGQLQAAQRQWEALREDYPESARAWGQLAGLYLCSERFGQRDLTRAKHYFRSVARIHGEYEAEPSVRIAQILAVQDSLARIEQTLDVISGRTEVPADVAFLRGYVAWREGRSRTAVVNLARSRQTLVADTAEAGLDPDFRVPQAYRNDVCRVLTEWRPDLVDRPPGQIQTDAVYTRFQEAMRQVRQTP